MLEEPDVAALRELYVELGFTSLLRELTPLASMHTDDADTDYAPLEYPPASNVSDGGSGGRDTAVWLGLDAQEPKRKASVPPFFPLK